MDPSCWIPRDAVEGLLATRTLRAWLPRCGCAADRITIRRSPRRAQWTCSATVAVIELSSMSWLRNPGLTQVPRPGTCSRRSRESPRAARRLTRRRARWALGGSGAARASTEHAVREAAVWRLSSDCHLTTRPRISTGQSRSVAVMDTAIGPRPEVGRLIAPPRRARARATSPSNSRRPQSHVLQPPCVALSARHITKER